MVTKMKKKKEIMRERERERERERKWVTFLHTSLVPLGHDGGHRAADTRRRDGSSDLVTVEIGV